MNRKTLLALCFSALTGVFLQAAQEVDARMQETDAQKVYYAEPFSQNIVILCIPTYVLRS